LTHFFPQSKLLFLAKAWVGGSCGNIHIIYEEEELKAAAKATLKTIPDAVAMDPGMVQFEEYWEFEGNKSYKQGIQGGRQRLKSKLEARLEGLASSMVRLCLCFCLIAC
jgi:hypothetical protein